MSRKKSREYAFRFVFEKFFHEPEIELRSEDEEMAIEDIDMDFVNSLIGGINEHYNEIMDILKINIVNYDIDRVYKIDLAILVIAVYELKFAENNNANIVINEAVELSKKYSTDKSYSFINGVLAKVVNND